MEMTLMVGYPMLVLQVKAGMNVLVCGPNGCGKSSLFRVLGEVSAMYTGMSRWHFVGTCTELYTVVIQ